MRRGILIAASAAVVLGVAVVTGSSFADDRGPTRPPQSAPDVRQPEATAAAEREAITTTRHSNSIVGVVVDNDAGDIEASPGVTKVVRTEKWAVARQTVTETVRAGVLTIKARCPQMLNSINKCSTRFRITAPAGAWVKLGVSAGNVSAIGFGGAHTVTSSAGNVVVSEARARRVTAKTSAGNVSVDLLEAPDTVTATTSAGNVLVALPRGRYALSARTSTGEPQVSGIQHDPTATRRIEARTSSGRIVVSGR